MPIKPTNNSQTTSRPEYENETYFARVVQVVDLGLQDGGEYQGNKKPDTEMVMFTFEFGEVLNGEGNPGWLSVRIPLPQRWDDGNFKGIHVKSNLYKYLQVLYPDGLYFGKNTSYANFSRDFNWENLLGKAVQLQVVVNDEGKAYINKGSIAKVPKKFEDSVPELKNTPVVVDMATCTKEEWDSLYPWVQQLIAQSLDPFVKERAKELSEDTAKTQTKATTKKPTEPASEDFNDEVPF